MRLITHITVSNLLSFGLPGLDLEMHDLNVLIGPNGSGKSNFLEIFEVLKSLPRNKEANNNLNRVISQGGGEREWIWKGAKKLNAPIEILVHDQLRGFLIKHSFSLDFNIPWGTPVSEEVIENVSNIHDKAHPNYYYKQSDKTIWDDSEDAGNYIEYFDDSSILAQRYINHGINTLVDAYEKIRLYREWSFGRNTIFRTPQRADLRNDRLESDFSNLGMFLSRLRKDPATKRLLISALKDLYEGLTDFEVVTEGGTVQIFFTEGDFSIPATRLSDGSLRYLCLVALLLDPTPPPLICIEEPELGLHPDILPKIADLLIDASQRTQLIVTTHSDVLIDALSSRPESVLVCEKHEGQTQIKRLNREDLSHWLEDYSLGQLWTRGEIGGTRW